MNATISTKHVLIILAVIVIGLVVWDQSNQARDGIADGYCHASWKAHVGDHYHEHQSKPIAAVPGYGTPEFYQFMEACKAYYHETR